MSLIRPIILSPSCEPDIREKEGWRVGGYRMPVRRSARHALGWHLVVFTLPCYGIPLTLCIVQSFQHNLCSRLWPSFRKRRERESVERVGRHHLQYQRIYPRGSGLSPQIQVQRDLEERRRVFERRGFRRVGDLPQRR